VQYPLPLLKRDARFFEPLFPIWHIDNRDDIIAAKLKIQAINTACSETIITKIFPKPG